MDGQRLFHPFSKVRAALGLGPGTPIDGLAGSVAELEGTLRRLIPEHGVEHHRKG